MRGLSPRKQSIDAKSRRDPRPAHRFRPGSDLGDPGKPIRLEGLEGRILTTYVLNNCMVSG